MYNFQVNKWSLDGGRVYDVDIYWDEWINVDCGSISAHYFPYKSYCDDGHRLGDERQGQFVVVSKCQAEFCIVIVNRQSNLCKVFFTLVSF